MTADRMTELDISPEAKAKLAEANALFPGRYELRLSPTLARWQVHDRDKRRVVATEDTPEAATEKALSSARLSAGNGRRRYAHGHAPEGRTITLFPEEWLALEANARRHGLSISDLIRTLAH